VPHSPLDTARLLALTGRVALVTGGSLGIGSMIAEGLVAAGSEDCMRPWPTE